MRVYKRGRVWYADFQHNGERMRKCLKALSKRDAEV